MTYQIVDHKQYVEVQASGSASHWDLLRLIHQLHKKDPKKEKPDLWVLADDFEISLYSFPPLVQGVLALLLRNTITKGAKSAILATDEFQRAKVELYCDEASSLPFPMQSFTARNEAMDWLLSAQD